MVYVALIFAVIGYFSLKPLFRQHHKRDTIVTIVIFAVCFAICMMQAGGVKIPSPTMALDSLVKSIGLSYPPSK